ncbi:hypothetical protein SAMN06273572_1012 [Monaibacterium marinum]|uniref:Uncharacterized protein n=1 Tax=Pontivivens marinum TaxID=1690039 RepID=A0A2C9CLP2_9RHOB|nr:hypothetical protein [Monaibacterium marinum]SOH92162.1 hypothetical protein SAMN06273572_1012 [Monaibacterium marinum]
MRDLNITIEGSWWDTLLYKGKLHALTPEGDWAVFDWDALTSDLEEAIEAAARPALQFSFRASNAISNGTLTRDTVTRAFEQLTVFDFDLSSKKMAKYLLAKSDVSGAFPNTSMNMHYDRMIMSSHNGVHIEYVNSDHIGVHILKKISSVATRQIAAAYGRIACASGDAGLRQLDLNLEHGFKPSESDGLELNSQPCDACDWMYQNISALSYSGGSYLAKFIKTGEFFRPTKTDDTFSDGDGAEIERIKFEENIDLNDGIDDESSEQDHALSWGSHDKIYKVSGSRISAYRFAASGERRLLGHRQLPADASEIVSVRSALFGVIVEFDEAVVVIKGDGTLVDFKGEPVNISTFSRSRRYENQLHLIADDSIQVKSINNKFENEYFLKKAFGSKAPHEWFG